MLATATASASTPAPDVEAALVSLINTARAADGVAPLRVDSTLAAGARAWSAEMAAAGVLGHDPAFTVVGASRWAENVGRTGDVTQAAAVLHEAFMASDAHRTNITDPSFGLVGIGAVIAGDSVWVTQRFADPTAEPATMQVVEAAVAGEATEETEPDTAAEPEPQAAAATPTSEEATDPRRTAASAADDGSTVDRAQARDASAPASQAHQTRLIEPPAAEPAGDRSRYVGGHGNGPAQAQGEQRRSR